MNHPPLTPTEASEMAVLAAWLNARGVLWFHPPNEGKRKPWVGARMRREGLAAGVPDVLVMERWSEPQGGHAWSRGVGLAVELKRIKGGRVAPQQQAWLDALRGRGWATTVAHGADEAIKWLSERLDTAQPKRGRGRMETEPVVLQGQIALLERTVDVLARHLVQTTIDMHGGLHGARTWVRCLKEPCTRTRDAVATVASETGLGDVARLVE